MRPIWAKLEELAANGIICAPEEVLLELERQEDDLYAWARANETMFVKPDRRCVEVMTDVVNAHPGLVKVNSTKSAGDPWVIALAEIHKVPVVHYETLAKKDAAPKIPNVCDSRKLQHVTLIDVLRAEGFRL